MNTLGRCGFLTARVFSDPAEYAFGILHWLGNRTYQGCKSNYGFHYKMRLDKFLQISRLVKRRTVANTLCSRGKILVNTKTAKAGKTLKIGDTITIISDPLPTEPIQELTYQILELPTGNVSKTRAETLYRRIE